MAIEFIKLTGGDKDIYVNPNLMTHFCARDGGGSYIIFCNDDNFFTVKETPEQIITKMKELQEERKQ